MHEQKETHFEGKVAQKAVIVRSGKILVLRDPRMDYEIWEIPGGRLNVGEDPKAGLAREIEEELGVSCEIGNVIHIAQFLPTDAVINPASDEVCEVRWIDADEFETLHFFPEYKDTLAIYFQNRDR
jgi:8-oxo-dGTP pyrophosphatase MutT (NUDIX family)